MSNAPSGETTTGYGAILQRKFPILRWVGAADDAVYAVERIVVTAAMLIMSAVVCIGVLFQFVAKQRATWNRLSGTEASIIDFWPALGVALAVALLARGVWNQSPLAKGGHGVVAALTLLTVVAFGIFSGALIVLPSKVVMALLIIGAGKWVMLAEFDRVRPLGTPRWDLSMQLRMGAAVLVTLALAVGAYLVTPERYSWTNKLALFLLLWTAFIGASMATHDQRHLTIDAFRKAIPARFLPYYQALSHLVAAVFTALFTYLAFRYLGVRLAENAAPGEIPDWLKVLAIPVSLTLVTLRFAGRASRLVWSACSAWRKAVTLEQGNERAWNRPPGDHRRRCGARRAALRLDRHRRRLLAHGERPVSELYRPHRDHRDDA